MLTTALLALGLQASHETLHPAGADLFLEVPDVPALLDAYASAPMARMFADEEASSALRDLLGDEELTGARLVERGLDLMGWTDASLEELRDLRALSVSLAGAAGGQGAYVLVVVDTASAERAAEWTASLGSGGEGWAAHEGARLVYGRGAMTPAVWTELRAGDAPTLSADALRPDAAVLRPTSGTVVVRGFQRGDLIGTLVDALQADANALSGAWTSVFGEDATRFRMALEGGRFVTETHSPGAGRPIAAAPWIAPKPVDTSLLAEVHPGALLVAAASFERAGLRDALARALGVDLTAAPLFDKLGSNAVLFAQPVRGMGLPKTYLALDLAEGAAGPAVLEDLVALAADLDAKQSKYKDVPYVTLTLPPELASPGGLGTVRPVITVFGDTLFVTNGTLTLKSEIRRRLGEERDQLGAPDYPWTRGEDVFPAGATAVLYVDWGAQVDGLFALARSFGGMISGFAPDLPFDLTSLPDPRIFTRHMRPTIHSVHHADGVHRRHEAGFAFETWIGLAGLAAVVVEDLEMSFVGLPEGAVVVGDFEIPGPQQETSAKLLLLRTALTVYKIDQGAYPATLETLLEPTANYPHGYLDGKTTLDPDAWGNPFRYELTEGGAAYRLWSTGADGVDQNGAGDDVPAL